MINKTLCLKKAGASGIYFTVEEPLLFILMRYYMRIIYIMLNDEYTDNESSSGINHNPLHTSLLPLCYLSATSLLLLYLSATSLLPFCYFSTTFLLHFYDLLPFFRQKTETILTQEQQAISNVAHDQNQNGATTIKAPAK